MLDNHEQQGAIKASKKIIYEKLKARLSKVKPAARKAMQTKMRRKFERLAGLKQDSPYFSNLLLAKYLLELEPKLLVDRDSCSEQSRLGHWARHFELGLGQYGIKKWNPYVQKDLPAPVKRAFHFVALAEKAAKENDKLTAFTLAIPYKLWSQHKNRKDNCRDLFREINRRLKKVSSDFNFTLELGGDGKYPHLHGVIVQPGDMANDEFKEKLVKAVGKTNNKTHQVRLKSCYSHGWLTYMCKQFDETQKLIGRSPYSCPQHISTSASHLYEQVREEVLDYQDSVKKQQGKATNFAGVCAKTNSEHESEGRAETRVITGFEGDLSELLEDLHCSYDLLPNSSYNLPSNSNFPLVEEHHDNEESGETEEAIPSEKLNFSEQQLEMMQLILKALGDTGKLPSLVDELSPSEVDALRLAEEDEASALDELEAFLTLVVDELELTEMQAEVIQTEVDDSVLVDHSDIPEIKATEGFSLCSTEVNDQAKVNQNQELLDEAEKFEQEMLAIINQRNRMPISEYSQSEDIDGLLRMLEEL